MKLGYFSFIHISSAGTAKALCCPAPGVSRGSESRCGAHRLRAVAGKTPHRDLAPFPPNFLEINPIICGFRRRLSDNHARFHKVTAAPLVPQWWLGLAKSKAREALNDLGALNEYEGNSAHRVSLYGPWRRLLFLSGGSKLCQHTGQAEGHAPAASFRPASTGRQTGSCTRTCPSSARQGQSGRPGAAAFLSHSAAHRNATSSRHFLCALCAPGDRHGDQRQWGRLVA